MNDSLKERVRELHRDACFLRTAIIKTEGEYGTMAQKKEKKSKLFKQKLEIEQKEKFFNNFIKEMEKKK